MASQINSTNIDGNYPIAGQDNSSQGFRTNFTNIKNNFYYAQNEIGDIQSKGIFKATLGNANVATTSLSVQNDMSGAPILNAEILGFRETIYSIGEVSGTETVDFTKGSYQTVTLDGSLVIGSITGWPSSGVQARMRLEVTVPNRSYTLTIPATVTLNATSIAGISGSTISFTNTGTYIFEFSTIDGGTNISIADITRNRNTFQGNVTITQTVSNTTATGISFTVSNIGGQVVGNIYANNIIASNLVTTGTDISLTGNVTAANIIANANIYGTIMTPIQSNITLLGNLSSLSVTGNANVGNVSITGLSDMCGGTAYGLLFVTMVDGSSQIIPSNCGVLILNASGTIPEYTIIMPSSPYNGQAIKIAFGVTVTTVNHTVSGGQSIKEPLTSGSVSGGGEWIYYATNSTWYRVT